MREGGKTATCCFTFPKDNNFIPSSSIYQVQLASIVLNIGSKKCRSYFNLVGRNCPTIDRDL